MTRCTATTRSGAPCRAHARRGTTLCAAHAPPTGNSFYQQGLSGDELRLLTQRPDDGGLRDEVLALKVLLRRVLIATRELDDLTPNQLARLLSTATPAARAIAYLLRSEQRIERRDEDSAIERALDLLSDDLDLTL